MKFNVNDTASWTPHYKSQVPHGMDPTDFEYFKRTGVFFMEFHYVYHCFESILTPYYLGDEGYKNTWYDVDDDDMWPDKRNFYFSPP